MIHNPYIFGNQGQPITVMYPGYYSNLTRQPVFNDYYEYPTYQYHPYYRKLPETDPTLFNESAISMQGLMKDASHILNHLATSKPFAKKVMAAAQASNLNEVNKLLKSTGIKSEVNTSFNPDGINLKLSSKVGSTDCCQLTIALRWR
ncbi:hypothetical protein [Fredinandcohnia sp. 179-A 10B2 NHS]|uniref:hypothetical protein n=1 Tax=Fredinandcohnia sp. 179-A 10B2 NHS TaxID=3235176 RepID=UPI0039A18F8B